MTNLGTRLWVAALLILGGFAALLLDLTARWAAIALVLVLGAWELGRMLDRRFGGPPMAWFSAAGVLAFVLPHFPGLALPPLWPWLVAVTVFCVYVAAGFRRVDIASLAPWLMMNAFVCAYLGLWAAKAFELTVPVTGWRGIGPFAFTLGCIALADSGAYFAGRAFGKRKLAPALSPKKTLEGAAGGMLVSMAFALGVGPVLVGLRPLPALLLGALLALASIAGDLFISALKRYADAKDTSHILPGHGGIMDRFDSLTFSVPIAWLGLKMAGAL